MADPEFEARLIRWFGDAPALADADHFAKRVEGRIDRSWSLRRAMIGMAGLAGGVIAVGQLLGARLFDHIAGLSKASVTEVSEGVRTVGQLRLLASLPVSGEVLWMGAGLAVLAVVLMATRSLEEF